FVVEAECVGESADVGFVAGEEVPAVLRAGASVALEIELAFGCGRFRRVFGIEREGYDFEVAAGGEGDGFQAALEAGEDLSTKHRAAVVDVGEDHRLTGLEEAGELDAAAEFVVEG